MSVFLTILKKGRNINLNVSFPEACRSGGTEAGVGILGNSLFFFLMSSLIALMGCLFGSRGGWSVEGVAFSQLCCDRSWKRTMAAACNDAVVGGSRDHARDVALIVAAKKVDCESDIYLFKRLDYTAEEWRWLLWGLRIYKKYGYMVISS